MECPIKYPAEYHYAEEEGAVLLPPPPHFPRQAMTLEYAMESVEQLEDIKQFFISSFSDLLTTSVYGGRKIIWRGAFPEILIRSLVRVPKNGKRVNDRFKWTVPETIEKINEIPLFSKACGTFFNPETGVMNFIDSLDVKFNKNKKALTIKGDVRSCYIKNGQKLPLTVNLRTQTVNVKGLPRQTNTRQPYEL